jgi:predicted ATPase/DNA-binding CsgD family transcriptional regulator
MARPPDARPETRGFPRALTSFLGRADDVDRLTRLLSGHRLVTVTGPGGVGKTRLAAEVTQHLPERFGDRVWLVELAAVPAAGQVPAAAAARLGAPPRAGRSVTQSVADMLAGEPSLLVLDNCEHVVAGVAEFCSNLLPRCDDLVILATSREPIGVAGEARMRLRPLAAGHPETPGTGEAGGVALFADRARLLDPAFELTAGSAALVSQIVARLDGLPLAIELAAARAESLGLTQLHAHLSEPLQVLTRGSRTAPARHRSLWAMADWSYQLLSEPLRRSFRRLAIFPGPFTLEAAETVAGSQAESAVPGLVDSSLLTPPRDGPDGRARYLMLSTLRAFALGQLDESGERDDAAAAMAAYAVAAASAAATGFRTAGGEVAAAGQLDAEDALVSQALSWALEHDAATALRLAVALSPWWQLRGRALTGYPLLNHALQPHARQPHASRDGSWAAAQKWLGRLAHSTGAYQPALAHFSALCTSLPADSPSRDLVDGLAGKSGSLRNLGRLADARDVARTALAAAQQLRYAEGEALALTQLSLVAGYADEAATAIRWADQAAQIDATRLPDKVARRVELILTVALTDCGDLDSARETCAQGLESARAAGDVTMQADFLYFTTHIALRAGQLDDAGAHIRESLRLTAQSGDWIRVLDCLDDCAQLCAATGRPAEALTLWAAHSARVAAPGTPALPQDTRRREGPWRRASERLGPAAAAAAERRGARMSLPAAAQFADMMAGPGPAPAGHPAGPVRLTPREGELLTLVAHGHTDAQIAEELFISLRTVRSHLDRIRDKTGSRRRADLTRLALRAGLV